MKKYYIIRSDGTPVFQQAYSEDFCAHCLINLIDRTPQQTYYLLDEKIRLSGYRAQRLCYLLVSEEQNYIFKYMLK